MVTRLSSRSSERTAGAVEMSAGFSAFGRRLILLACLLAIAGLVSFAIDLPVARWCRTNVLPKELLRLLNFCEVFGHGIGVAILVTAVFVLDRSLQLPSLTWPAIRWPTFPPTPAKHDAARLLAAILTGPLLVLLLKRLNDRVRPRAADLEAAASVWDTFTAETVGRGVDGIMASGTNLDSFPSGHSSTAAALAAALAWKYPHGRLFFMALAGAACLQRIVTSAHYPSDACWGAAIGVAGACLFLGRGAPVAGRPREW